MRRKKIVLLLKKLKKMVGEGTPYRRRKKKAMSASRSERELRDGIVQLAMESLCLQIEGAAGTNGK